GRRPSHAQLAEGLAPCDLAPHAGRTRPCQPRVRRITGGKMAQQRTTTITAEAAGIIALGGDLPVRRMGFGAMRITGEGIWGEPRDPEACKRVLRRAIQVGGNVIDTADSYGPVVSAPLIAV